MSLQHFPDLCFPLELLTYGTVNKQNGRLANCSVLFCGRTEKLFILDNKVKKYIQQIYLLALL